MKSVFSPPPSLLFLVREARYVHVPRVHIVGTPRARRTATRVSIPRDEPHLSTLPAEVSGLPDAAVRSGAASSTPELNPNPYVNRTPDPANRIPHSARFVYAYYTHLSARLPTYLPTGLGRCRRPGDEGSLCAREREERSERRILEEGRRARAPLSSLPRKRTAIVRRYVVNFIKRTNWEPAIANIYLLICRWSFCRLLRYGVPPKTRNGGAMRCMELHGRVCDFEIGVYESGLEIS